MQKMTSLIIVVQTALCHILLLLTLSLSTKDTAAHAQQQTTGNWTPPSLNPQISDELPRVVDVSGSSSNRPWWEPVERRDAEYRLLSLWRTQRNTVRPRRTFTDIVDVTIGFGLFQISQIEEDISVGVLHGWTMMIWDDDYHKWNVSEYGGLRSVSVPAELVWKPDIVQYSGATRDKTVNIFGNTNVNIFYNGRIMWTPPTTIYVPLRPIGGSSWPRDRHSITFKLGTWSYGTALVNLVPANATALSGGAADTSEYVEGPRWKLLSFTGREQKQSFKCCPGARISMMTFDVEIERKSNFLFHLVGWPLKLVLFSTCMIFLLPLAAVSFRLLVCGTYFMTYAVLLLVVQQIIPHGAIYGRAVPAPVAAVVCAIALLLGVVCTVALIGAIVRVNKYRFPLWATTVLHAIASSMLFDNTRVINDDAVALYHRMSDDALAVAVMPPPHAPATNNGTAATNGAATNGAGGPWSTYNTDATSVAAANEAAARANNEWRLLAAVLNRFAFVVNLILCIVITVATP